MSKKIAMPRISILVTRWIARAISTFAATIWLLILLDVVACDELLGYACVNWKMVLLVIFAAVSVFSVTLAWHKEGSGGIFMLAWGIIFTLIAVIDSGNNQIVVALATGIPFFIAGLLFLTSWRITCQAQAVH